MTKPKYHVVTVGTFEHIAFDTKQELDDWLKKNNIQSLDGTYFRTQDDRAVVIIKGHLKTPKTTVSV